MKIKNILLIGFIASLCSGCALLNSLMPNKNGSSSTTSSEQGSNSGSNSTSGSNSSSTTSSGSGKTTVPAHTLRDSNPPIDVESDGEEVDLATWNSFRSAPQSAFNRNYNYTYRAYSGGQQTVEMFTTDGYYVSSTGGVLRYERKSGNKFYQYISASDGYLREETTLDLQYKYTYRIWHEISVHMFDMSEYKFFIDNTYVSNEHGYTSQIKFQGGYLTLLRYYIGTDFSFEIYQSFETEIEIPQSYYI